MNNKSAKKSLSALALALLMTSPLLAASYSPDMPQNVPQEKIPMAEKASSERILISPLSLETCFKLALKRSEVIAIRKEEIEVTEAQFLKALSEALGDADFVVTGFHQDAPSPTGSESGVSSTFNAKHRRERKFVLKQPLFQGFKSLGALMGAGSLKKQREDEKIRAEQLLFLDVSRAFYDLLRLKKDVEIIARMRDLYKERIEELSEREKIGRSRPSEIATATARMKLLEADLAKSRGAFVITQRILEFLTGIEMDPSQIVEEDLENKDAHELTDYLKIVKLRPDVEASKQALKTARNGVVVAQSALWPELSLENNQYMKREGFQSGVNWDLLLKLNVPLFRGGETLGKIKEAVSSWKKAKLSYSLKEREAEFEIKEAYQGWVTSRERFEALHEALKASEENFQFQKDEYTRNLVSNLDVLEALESLHQTSRQTNEAHYELKQNYWRLKVATGEAL